MTSEAEEKDTKLADNALGELAVVGINHHSATLSEREPYQITRPELIPAVKELIKLRGVREGMILSTCNRFECYMVLDDGEEPFAVARDFFVRFKGLDPRPNRKLFYVRHGSTAVRHLFRVTGGLDSLVLGEYQIQSQIKEGYSSACSVNATGKVLHRLFHVAFRAGKAIRTRTAVGAGRMSVAGMAVGLLKEKQDKDAVILMIGANDNIRIVAEGLKGAGFEKLLFANRTAYKAEKLAGKYGGEGFSLENLPELMARADCVVSCTGAPGFLVEAALFDQLISKQACPKLCIDIAVPRDLEGPSDSTFPMELIDLEDLKGIRDNRMETRKGELPAAKKIVEDLVNTFQSWMECALDPGAGALINEFERIRQARLREAQVSFRDEDFKALERFSRDLVRDLLKVPVRTIVANAPPLPSHKNGG